VVGFLAPAAEIDRCGNVENTDRVLFTWPESRVYSTNEYLNDFQKSGSN